MNAFLNSRCFILLPAPAPTPRHHGVQQTARAPVTLWNVLNYDVSLPPLSLPLRIRTVCNDHTSFPPKFTKHEVGENSIRYACHRRCRAGLAGRQNIGVCSCSSWRRSVRTSSWYAAILCPTYRYSVTEHGYHGSMCSFI